MAEEAVCKGGRDPLREWLDKTYIVFAQHPCQGISNYFTQFLKPLRYDIFYFPGTQTIIAKSQVKINQLVL